MNPNLVDQRTMPMHVKTNPILGLHWTEIYRKDLDELIGICGRRGHCKSGTMITHGILFDWSNYLNRSRMTLAKINFKAGDFIKHFDKNVKHPTGTVICWDEIGVENDSRSWYSARNKLIKYLIETNRYRNYCILLTAPSLKSFDISTQRCLTGIINMQGKTREGNRAKGTYYQVETNYKGDKYQKRPRVLLDNKKYIIDGFTIPKPPKIFELAYQKKKDDFVNNWNKIIDDEISMMEDLIGDKKKEHKSNLDLEGEVLDHWSYYFDEDLNKFDTSLVMSQLGIANAKAQQIASALNSKIKRGFLVKRGDRFVDNSNKHMDEPLKKEKDMVDLEEEQNSGPVDNLNVKY